jgi:hypothetical protein
VEPGDTKDLEELVAELRKTYSDLAILNMLLNAIKWFRAAGHMDPPGTLPRAGNICGQFTRFFLPLSKALKVGWRYGTEAQPSSTNPEHE